MMENTSALSMFTLSGLDFSLEQRIALFVGTILWYLLILWGNLTLIFVIITDRHLHEPMYVFVCNLCLNSVYGTVGFFPKFLKDLFSSHVISYAACMLQGYVIHSSTCADFSILTLMAYVAICQPLSYHAVMTKLKVSVFLFLSWFIPLFCMFMNTATLIGVRLCGSRINRLYCVNWTVFRLTCSPPMANVAVSYFNMLFYFGHAVFIAYTYLYMIRTCKLSRENMGKFMQTCLPHLICLGIYSTTVLLDLLYIRFGSADLSQHLSNFMAIENLLIPPLLNPLVYGFKLTKLCEKMRISFEAIKHVLDCNQTCDFSL
uniref:G-protein coupled receptors family 1 profile domain-containing protein n=1 Tax=Salarias fasciatus TaxID=181472 RepID=A0A672G169_SALFA